MRNGSSTIFYYDENTEEDIWEEELEENTRVPGIGEKVYIKDCKTDYANAKEGEYTMKSYEVIDVETFVLINRGFDAVTHQYSGNHKRDLSKKEEGEKYAENFLNDLVKEIGGVE